MNSKILTSWFYSTSNRTLVAVDIDVESGMDPTVSSAGMVPETGMPSLDGGDQFRNCRNLQLHPGLGAEILPEGQVNPDAGDSHRLSYCATGCSFRFGTTLSFLNGLTPRVENVGSEVFLQS